MARFLFTMLPANDLGLPTRMVPIARTLVDRGHEVAVFNPAPAPQKLIAEAGLMSIPMPATPTPSPVMDLALLSTAFDVDHFFAGLYMQEEYVRGTLAVYLDLMRNYAPDLVVDSFDPLACLSARVLKLPLTTVLQGNFHPASRGFLWWEQERPSGLPSATGIVNSVSSDYGLAPVNRCADLLAGDLSLIVGTPETDPVAADADVEYVGPMVFQRGDATLPPWVDDLDREHASYVPGPLMAGCCDLIVFHGGHSSVMTCLKAGTPAVVIPTITERESNARRLASLGAGEVVMPVNDANGEKHVDAAEFSAKVKRVLKEPAYRESAQRVAESMRRFGGTATAADRIEEFAAALAR